MTLGLSLMLMPVLEQRRELRQELRQLLPGLGVAGTPKNLEKVLDTVPQTTDGEVNYLISGGWGCDILSGEQRNHQDIDLIVLEDGVEYMDTDNKYPDDYFGILSMDEEEIRRNHVHRGYWSQAGRIVYIPSPEFLIASKIAPFEGKPSREKDLNDVYNVMRTVNVVDFNKLRSVFSKVSGLAEPERYALCLARLQGSIRDADQEQFKQALAITSQYLTDSLK